MNYTEIHQTGGLTEFTYLAVIVGSIVFFTFVILPILGKLLVKGIDGVVGKGNTEYNYTEQELY
jgi:hypothetical protein